MRVNLHRISATFGVLAAVGFAAVAVLDGLAGEYGRVLLDLGAMFGFVALALANGTRANARYKLTLAEHHIATLVRVARSESEGTHSAPEVWSAIRAAEWYLRQVGKEQGA